MKEKTIAGLAKAAGVGVETVRYYQRRGLMNEPPRSGGTGLTGGIRRYGAEDLRRLRFIRSAQAAGFTLDSRSPVNDNPRDTKNYPNGVWSLPPVLRGGDTDREVVSFVKREHPVRGREWRFTGNLCVLSNGRAGTKRSAESRRHIHCLPGRDMHR